MSEASQQITVSEKFPIPEALYPVLDSLAAASLKTATEMLTRRNDKSSKFWKMVPCVVAKGLTEKYQKNPKCKSIRHLAIPIHGDKGRVIKLDGGGIKIQRIFKTAIIPCCFKRPVCGFIRSAEFLKRNGRWFVSLSYYTDCDHKVIANGAIGVDRNSVGNVAVMADPQNGTVRHLGFNPARTKACWRGRNRNLQRQGKRRLLSKLRRNQMRRTTHQNHVVSKTIVDYAKKHSRAIALEKLDRVTTKGSKIRVYSLRNQWAFAQLSIFIHYKARLAGVPVIEVDPAYTSQTCSRCGHIHKTSGKLFRCATCGHQDHRDANASFNIARRGWESIGGLAMDFSAPSLGPSGGPRSGKEKTFYV